MSSFRVVNESQIRRSIRRTVAEIDDLERGGGGPAVSEIRRQAVARASQTGARTVRGTPLGAMTVRAMTAGIDVRTGSGELWYGGVGYAVGAELGGQARPRTRMFGRYRPTGYVLGPVVDNPDRRLDDALAEPVDDALDTWGRGT